jgi:hypothetical protein
MKNAKQISKGVKRMKGGAAKAAPERAQSHGDNTTVQTSK